MIINKTTFFTQKLQFFVASAGLLGGNCKSGGGSNKQPLFLIRRRAF
jgi:hypothetical protein